MIKMLLLWVAALTLVGTELAALDRPRMFCGRALAEAMTLYCLGIDDDTLNTYLQQKWSSSSPTGYKWLMSRHITYVVGGALVAECCLKPCYLSELLSYC